MKWKMVLGESQETYPPSKFFIHNYLDDIC